MVVSMFVRNRSGPTSRAEGHKRVPARGLGEDQASVQTGLVHARGVPRFCLSSPTRTHSIMSSDKRTFSELTEDLKQAMRDKDKVRLRTLRSLRAALKNQEIEDREEGQGVTLEEQTQLKVLRKQIKQREDAIEMYEDAERDDLVEKEKEELQILKEYMPEPVSDEELKRKIRSIIDEMEADSLEDMGPVMGQAMGTLQGRVDGNRVKEIVKSLLTS